VDIIDRLDDYQRAAARTLISKPDSTYSHEQLALVWLALVLAGAAGEFVDMVKKAVFHQHGVNERELSGAISKLLLVARSLDAMQIGLMPELPEATLSDAQIMQIWCALGLVREAGEVAATIERSVVVPEADYTPLLVKELGDNLWYNAAIATLIGAKLSAIASINNDKLQQRYRNGYSSAASISRDTTQEG